MISAALIALMASTVFASDEDYCFAFTNVDPYLSVRSGPGTDYEIVASLPYGTVITILDASDPIWVKFSFDGLVA